MNSLRQDLWLATDQAYKQALDGLAQKHGLPRHAFQAARSRRFFGRETRSAN